MSFLFMPASVFTEKESTGTNKDAAEESGSSAGGSGSEITGLPGVWANAKPRATTTKIYIKNCLKLSVIDYTNAKLAINDEFKM